jgi:hypothetical protein
MTTAEQINEVKMNADIRITACDDTWTVAANKDIQLAGRGIKHIHAHFYSVTDAALKSLKRKYFVVTDF